MLNVTISEAVFESAEFSNHKVKLSRFNSNNQGMLEFVKKSSDKSYTIPYSVFNSACEVIFLHGVIIPQTTLPENVKVKDFIVYNKIKTDVCVVLDVIAQTASIGFIYSSEYGSVLENDCVDFIPFKLFNELKKTIEREIMLPTKISTED